MRVSAHGLSVEVPPGWEARIVRRTGAPPVLHVASFALSDRDGDFGAAATGRMRPGDAFAALVTYRVDGHLRPGKGLFTAPRPAAPLAGEFGPRQLQVTRRGQLGWQRFFTEAGRPYCWYAVIHPAGSLSQLVEDLGRVLATVRLPPPESRD